MLLKLEPRVWSTDGSSCSATELLLQAQGKRFYLWGNVARKKYKRKDTRGAITPLRAMKDGPRRCPVVHNEVARLQRQQVCFG